MRLDEATIADIRHSANVVDVISHYIPVTKKGKGYVALCPFHSDHDPSLSISQEKQIWRCFVCGEGGSVFDFIQKFEKVSFVESVAEVGKLIGKPIELDTRSYQKPMDPHQAALIKTMKEANRFFCYSLNTQEAKEKKTYLEKRGITQDLQERFEIGYNPTGNALYKFLQAKGYEDELILGTGLAVMGERGIHDFFSDRITFPISDANGNPIAISARTLDPDQAKYVNTSQTELYVKGDVIYNYHQAKGIARKEGVLYVCEGVTDVIAFAKAGIMNAVATLGTSCTKNQIQQLKHGGKVVFCYDGDRAGQVATYKAGKMANSAGCPVYVVLNDTQLDPDEIVRQKGPETLKALTEKPITWIEFVFEYLKTYQYDLGNYEDAKKYAKEVYEEILTLKDPFDRDNFAKRLETLTGLSLESLKQQVSPKPKSTTSYKGRSPVKQGVTVSAENQILAQMLVSKDASEIFKQQLAFLPSSTAMLLAMDIIDEYRKVDTILEADFLDHLKNEEEKSLMMAIVMSDVLNHTYDEAVLKGSISKVKSTQKKLEIQDLKEKLKVCLDPKEKEALNAKLEASYREYRGYIHDEN